MARRLRGPTGIIVVLALLAMTSAALAREPEHLPQSGAASQLFVTKVISPAEQKAALTFWTNKAIASAQPLEMKSQPGTAAVAPEATLSEAKVTGPAGFAPAGCFATAVAAMPHSSCALLSGR